MDINNLKDQVSNLTLYDLKAGFRKAQNAVMNYTEMEAKVIKPVLDVTTRIPTDCDAVLSQTLNEIMPMIYRRFTEKSAEEWRQIYKALQLLEYLIKHGSERVIDDARGHITLLKMLRQFHFIDQNGKDQGINVRNRAKELAELLGDVERIRSERKKARTNKAKYTGVEGGSSGFSSSSRYGGFGSESGGYGGGSTAYGGYSGGVYGDGGGFGGQSDDWRDSSNRADKFEEYDEYDEGTSSHTTTSRRRTERAERAGVKKTTGSKAPEKKKEPEVDLFSFDEPESSTTAPPVAAPSNGSSALTGLSNSTNDDDDFDDFQSAAPAPPPVNSFGMGAPMVTSSAQSTATFAAPKPVSGPQQANLSDMMSSLSPPPSSNTTPAVNYSAFNVPTTSSIPAQAPKPAGYQAAAPNYFQSVQAQSTGSSLPGFSSTPTLSNPSGMSAHNKPAAPVAKPAAAGGDPFANLWGQAGGTKKTTPVAGPKMGELAKEKTNATLWGAPAASTPKPAASSQPAGTGSNGLDDLLG
ncbi:putative epsin-3 protein [Eutypa lata UCREL1]|uniref:Putative epsin-3 protein n=1 Tax=Eutypa lata (strain UCR-EL1) TaxID=1287681 RepID=M7TD83_EUTLA|nr:putative epsin-3 protein [Eutypa lata UCREL1]